MEKRNVVNFKARKRAIAIARRKAILKRVAVAGVVFAASTIGISSIVNAIKDNSKDNDSVSSVVAAEESYVIDTSTEDLSTLNVVLINDGISDEKMSQVENSLEASGLDVDVRNISDFYKDNTECFVSITSYQGDNYKIVGNYNKGNNHADLLAIGMKEAFDGVLQKGVYDTSETQPTLVPSDIEKAVGNQIMPNVTIVVPEDKDLEDNGNDFNKSFSDRILEGLARYNDSLKYVDIYDGEFLLRPNPFDNPSDYQKSVDRDVLRVNGLENSYDVQKDSILLNKWLPKSFDEDAIVNVEKIDIKENSLN
ncbi:MAG TPA: hypothetical protein IAB59_04070 [Candidatus Onthousia faecipullorum]|uniref:Uncharacterized protein n=1 Tax=Candidatus Onthousia faecipullorum TaxID=2840887 RepID=A0A9D1GAQ2_9FIRM|nr:hypothetical protein [Candidatus Onthousia faecipullorum]